MLGGPEAASTSNSPCVRRYIPSVSFATLWTTLYICPMLILYGPIVIPTICGSTKGFTLSRSSLTSKLKFNVKVRHTLLSGGWNDAYWLNAKIDERYQILSFGNLERSRCGSLHVGYSVLSKSITIFAI